MVVAQQLDREFLRGLPWNTPFWKVRHFGYTTSSLVRDIRLI